MPNTVLKVKEIKRISLYQRLWTNSALLKRNKIYFKLKSKDNALF